MTHGVIWACSPAALDWPLSAMASCHCTDVVPHRVMPKQHVLCVHIIPGISLCTSSDSSASTQPVDNGFFRPNQNASAAVHSFEHPQAMQTLSETGETGPVIQA